MFSIQELAERWRVSKDSVRRALDSARSGTSGLVPGG